MEKEKLLIRNYIDKFNLHYPYTLQYGESKLLEYTRDQKQIIFNEEENYHCFANLDRGVII